jgi:hypothetical protein
LRKALLANNPGTKQGTQMVPCLGATNVACCVQIIVLKMIMVIASTGLHVVPR